MTTTSIEARVGDGIERAVTHAEEVRAGWQDEALEYLRAFVRSTDGPFLLEEVRHWAEGCGLAPSPDARAWGGVIRAAQRERLVAATGYRTDRWGSPKHLWAAVAV